MSQAGMAGGGGGGGGDLETLTGDLGGAVSPIAGNIDITGDQDPGGNEGVLVVGNLLAGTLQIFVTGRSLKSVQTTNATPTTIATVTLDPNSSVTVFVEMTAANTAYSAAMSGTLLTGARRAGAGAILLNSPIINITDDFPAIVNMNAIVTGNDLQIQVIGIAATTINWKCILNAVIN